MLGIWIPFFGTALGAACTFAMRGTLNKSIQQILSGFAAGVMIAASIWSLLLPAMARSESMGRLRFVPATLGFVIGVGTLLISDRFLQWYRQKRRQAAPIDGRNRVRRLLLAVTVHNIPEGMAVGAVYAGWLVGQENITLMAATVLALGIGIQNIPEGAIVSLPLYQSGMSRTRAFVCSVLSGAVEPLAAVATILLAWMIVPALPYFLSFAAGTMMVVVVEELVPEMAAGSNKNIGTIWFAIGFLLMMILDVALG